MAQPNSIMKHLAITLFVLLFSTTLVAQKYAIVDSKYILNSLPEYHEAQKDLNELSTRWQRDIEQRHETVDKLKKSLEAERVLLTDDMIKTREEEIQQKSEAAREEQRKRFGVNGDLFKRRQEMIQPIQDMVYEAISEVADRSGYMVVFDKGINSNILYVNNKFDLSDRILRRMGVRPGGGAAGDADDSDDEDDVKQESSPQRGSTPDRGSGRDMGQPSGKPAGGGVASPRGGRP